ncbi:MAG: toll/interleukin-1 receptor domain-containing protein [bacterium]|nr:MAG: toll/interleukin-1 receptor domain-containing protein [bacterium]
MQAEKDVFHYAKSFFGFNNENRKITIVVPHIEQTRTLSLRCRNYPLFNYEISPDDAFSTFRILGLLSAIYGKRTNISIVNDTEYREHEKTNSIFIGGPPTNAYVYSLTQTGPLKFGENNEQRTIHGLKDIYWIKFREHSNRHTTQRIVDSLSIKEDYCLISKNTIDNHVQFVIGGLRAYGQRAVYDFLNDSNFYRSVESLFKHPFFRILVRVKVNNYQITDPWEIVEAEKSEDKWKNNNNKLNIFLSYLSDDWEKSVCFLKERLRQEYFDVFVDKDITVGNHWEKTIKAKIKHADVFLVSFSKKYMKRREAFVDYELDCAIKQHKPIIPLRFDTCRIHPSLRVHKIEWLDLFGDWRKTVFDWKMKDWTREKNLRKLIKALYKKQREKNLK